MAARMHQPTCRDRDPQSSGLQLSGTLNWRGACPASDPQLQRSLRERGEVPTKRRALLSCRAETAGHTAIGETGRPPLIAGGDALVFKLELVEVFGDEKVKKDALGCP